MNSEKHPSNKKKEKQSNSQDVIFILWKKYKTLAAIISGSIAFILFLHHWVVVPMIEKRVLALEKEHFFNLKKIDLEYKNQIDSLKSKLNVKEKKLVELRTQLEMIKKIPNNQSKIIILNERIALLEEQVDFYKKQISILQKYLENSENLISILDTNELYELAKANYIDGLYDKAKKNFSNVIRRNKKDIEVYIHRGNTYNKLGFYDLAIKDYNKAIELINHQYKNQIYNNRGIAYTRQGFIDQAIIDFSKTIEISPKDFLTYNNRGITFRRKGLLLEAISDFNKAIQIKPRYFESYYNRANVYLQKRDYERALADFDKAIALNPKHADSYFNRGSTYFKMGIIQEANSNRKKAIELNQKYSNKYYK